MTYDMATGSITEDTEQHVPVSKASLNHWLHLTGTFLEILPRKGYATRQSCSWPVFQNQMISFWFFLVFFFTILEVKVSNEAEQSLLIERVERERLTHRKKGSPCDCLLQLDEVFGL